MTPKKDQMIEDDMIKSFKFLNIDSDGFNKFIENKKSSWRYINYDLSTFFFYKYMANPIKTYNNSQNFIDFNILNTLGILNSPLKKKNIRNIVDILNNSYIFDKILLNKN